MYDPLVVDTFMRVHTSLTESLDINEPSATSLRAITEASGPALIHLDPHARFDEIAASSDEMLTLFELARSLSSNMSGQDASDLIAKHLRRLVPSFACVFYMLDEQTDELVALYASGEHAGFIKGLRVPRGQRLSGWVAANRQTIRNSDPVLDLGESARAMNPRPRSSLSTPLLVQNRLVGVLSLYSSNKEAYSEDHERIVEVVARQVSSVLLEATISERTRSQSFKDESTGLPNLRHFFELVEAQLVKPDERHTFCLVVMKIGAQMERGAGDEVVSAVRRALRPSDLLFSSAADELVALLLNTDLGASAAITGRIGSSLKHLRTDGRIGSVRLGVSCAPTEGSSGHELLNVARQRASTSIKPADTDGAIH
jgi:GGDEF domain-containing protein